MYLNFRIFSLIYSIAKNVYSDHNSEFILTGAFLHLLCFFYKDNKKKTMFNPDQLEAIEAGTHAVNAEAPPGSGKTLVLVYRADRMMSKYNILPREICCITFTKKAAAEMEHRLETLVHQEMIKQRQQEKQENNVIDKVDYSNIYVSDMMIGTFHHVILELLHRFDKTPRRIMDEKESRKTCLQLLSNHNLTDKEDIKNFFVALAYSSRNRQTPQDWFEYTSNLYSKGAGRGEGEEIQGRLINRNRKYASVMQQYQKHKLVHKKMDFDDIIILGLELMERNEDTRKKIASLFKYVCVDEFQDTDKRQYEFIKLLCKDHGNITIAGDLDQSAYGFRGANSDENMALFRQDFNPQNIFLRYNYRSEKPIVWFCRKVIDSSVTKEVISFKHERNRGKPTYPVVIRQCENERDEANWIAYKIHTLKRENPTLQYKDIAIIYRTRFVTKAVERILPMRGIPLRCELEYPFFDRKEIRIFCDYLYCICNPNASMDIWKNIINCPTRGIGQVTLQKLNHEMTTNNFTSPLYVDDLNNKNVKEFLSMMLNLFECGKTFISKHHDVYNNIYNNISGQTKLPATKCKTIRSWLEFLLKETKIQDFVMQQQDTTSDDASGNFERWDNVKQLIDIISNYKTIDGFLKAVDPLLHKDKNTKKSRKRKRPGFGKEEEEKKEQEEKEKKKNKNSTDESTSMDIDNNKDTNDDDDEVYLPPVVAPSRDAINMVTGHQSKGLEWQVCFVMAAEDGSIPHYLSYTEEQKKEELRIFNIMCSRPKTILCVSWCKSRKVFGTSRDQTVSPFLLPFLKMPKESIDSTLICIEKSMPAFVEVCIKFDDKRTSDVIVEFKPIKYEQ